MELMSDIQCMYVFGKNMDKNLGRVSCHAYFEFECRDIDINRLGTAWKKIFEIYRPLRCRYDNGMIVECDGLPACAELKIIDISSCSGREADDRKTEIRQTYSHRCLNIAGGECCGLIYVKERNSCGTLIFDWDLSVGDVRSFVNVLNLLADIYTGEDTHCLKQPRVEDAECIDERKEMAVQTKEVAEEIISEDLDKYVILPNLKMKSDPVGLSSCTYNCEDVYVDSESYKHIMEMAEKNGWRVEEYLAYAFSHALMQETGDESVVLNVPWFERTDMESDKVGDFTDIKLIPVSRKKNRTVREGLKELADTFDRYMSFSGYGITKLRKKIMKKYPDTSFLGPVVFSPMMQVPLLSKSFGRNIGSLKHMISQTPQVWLDVQTFEYHGKIYISLVYPEELFKKELIKNIASKYKEILTKITDEIFIECYEW